MSHYFIIDKFISTRNVSFVYHILYNYYNMIVLLLLKIDILYLNICQIYLTNCTNYLFHKIINGFVVNLLFLLQNFLTESSTKLE